MDVPVHYPSAMLRLPDRVREEMHLSFGLELHLSGHYSELSVVVLYY